MRNAAALLATHALFILLLPAWSLPSSPLNVGGLVEVPAIRMAKARGVTALKKSPSPFTELKREISVDEALDRVATFRQYFLVGFKWSVETLAIMAGVFSTQRNFKQKHESIIGTFAMESATSVAGVCNSCFFAGQAIGVLIAGRIGDTFGRRAALLISSGTISAFAVLTACSGSALTFAVMRLCTGLGVGLGGANAYILATEFVGSKHNGIAGIGMAAFGALGMLLVAPLALQVRNWRVLMLLVAAANLYPLLLHKEILESPRWLLAHGHRAEAKATILRAVAAVRQINPADEGLQLSAAPPATARREEGLGRGLRHRGFRRRLLVMAGCWFMTGLVFYGLACSVGRVGGSAHVNQSLFAIADVCAIPLQLLLVSTLGRRPSVSLASFLAAVGLLSAARGASSLAAARAALLVAKVATTALFALVYLWAAELFPTSLRATTLALCSFCSRVASILVPLLLAALDPAPAPHLARATAGGPPSVSPVQAAGLQAGAGSLPPRASGDSALYSLFAGAMLSTGAAALLFLPETRGHGLPQRLEDLWEAK